MSLSLNIPGMGTPGFIDPSTIYKTSSIWWTPPCAMVRGEKLPWFFFGGQWGFALEQTNAGWLYISLFPHRKHVLLITWRLLEGTVHQTPNITLLQKCVMGHRSPYWGEWSPHLDFFRGMVMMVKWYRHSSMCAGPWNHTFLEYWSCVFLRISKSLKIACQDSVIGIL